MKKILGSVGVLAVVGALVWGATGAFFSDTETSTGNTFTAGAIDLKIDSQTHYNGNVCELVSDHYQWTGTAPYPVPGTDCTGTWPLKDLTDTSATASQLFNFSDLKPGDWGENTISLHVFNNDAWLCAQTADVVEGTGITTEPELADENPAGTDTAQLLNSMQFFAWNDVNGNNIYEPNGGDTAYYTNPVPASQVITNGVWAIADSSTNSSTGGQPVAGNSDPAVGTKYLGVAWCLGTMTVDGSGAISCDGSSVNNASQGDTASFDVTFTAVQSRNNTNFVCGQSQEQRPIVGANFSTYATPTCTVTVQPGGLIQAAIDGVSAGSTVCVASGSHTTDTYPLVINKDNLTLAGLGAAGSASLAGGVRVDNDGATVEGLTIHNSNFTGEIAAVYLSAGVDSATVKFNDLSGPGKTTANSSGLINVTGFTTSGLTFNNNKSHDWLRGIFLNDSTSMTLSYNTLTGNGVGSANDHPHGNILTNNLIKNNTIEGVGILNDSGDTFTANINSIYDNNTTNSNNDLHNYGAVSVNAQSNWWGDTNPADNVAGTVDYTSFAPSAYTEN